MAIVANPKVDLLDFGPSVTLENGEVITPDDIVYGAANTTYRDMGALREIIDLKEKDPNLEEKVKSMLIKVGGAGHASMATTPGFWAFLEGDCSKLVDSAFTVMRFGSALMPSGRRVPIEEGQIIIPEGVADAGGATTHLYVSESEKNIEAYRKLIEGGVSKQEASKIVQYGHRGGGLLFMPLETLVHFSRIAENSPEDLPIETVKIIQQLEEQACQKGMGITYEARKGAPRTGCPHPNIFHSRENFAEEMVNQYGLERLSRQPKILSLEHSFSPQRDELIRNYLEKRQSCFSQLNSIEASWPELMRDLDEIVNDFNDSVLVKILSLVPWRVWGEIKRHRTLSQTAESIYSAIGRAFETLDEMVYGDLRSQDGVNNLKEIMSLPGKVVQDERNLELWFERFRNSLQTYDTLIEEGVPKGEAVAIIPRGLKLGVIKNMDLYNLTTGYASLRLCETAEPEMRRITEQERRLIQSSPDLSEEVKALISPKCAYTGFCPELGGFCPRITRYVPGYNDDLHSGLKKGREDRIRLAIDSGKSL